MFWEAKRTRRCWPTLVCESFPLPYLAYRRLATKTSSPKKKNVPEILCQRRKMFLFPSLFRNCFCLSICPQFNVQRRQLVLPERVSWHLRHNGGVSGWERTPSDAATSVVLPRCAVASPHPRAVGAMQQQPNTNPMVDATARWGSTMQRRVALQCVRTISVSRGFCTDRGSRDSSLMPWPMAAKFHWAEFDNRGKRTHLERVAPGGVEVTTSRDATRRDVTSCNTRATNKNRTTETTCTKRA